MDAVAHRTFASDARELRRLSTWWRTWALEVGLTDDIVDDGELCLNEAVGNIIQHGGTHERPSIAVALARETETVRITISDDLFAFNPLEQTAHVAPTTLSDARVGGLGIHLIRAYATDAHYRRDQGRNVLTLVFRRDSAR